LAFSLETGRWPAQVGKLALKSGYIDSKDIDIQFMREIRKKGGYFPFLRFNIRAT
jgi:hypothetical protein